MSILFNLTGTSSVLQNDIYPPLHLHDGNYQIGLIYFIGTNSIYNITPKNNKIIIDINKNVMPDFPGISIAYELDPGIYDMDNLKTAIQSKMRLSLTKFTEEYVGKVKVDVLSKLETSIDKLVFRNHTRTQKLEFIVNPVWSLTFAWFGSFADLLGIPETMLPFVTSNTTDKDILDKLYPIRLSSCITINIHCNLTGNSYINGKASHLIYSIPLSQAPGYRLIEAPKDVVFLPVIDTIIDTIEVRITDQNNELIDFRGDHLVVVLELRKQ